MNWPIKFNDKREGKEKLRERKRKGREWKGIGKEREKEEEKTEGHCERIYLRLHYGIS